MKNITTEYAEFGEKKKNLTTEYTEFHGVVVRIIIVFHHSFLY